MTRERPVAIVTGGRGVAVRARRTHFEVLTEQLALAGAALVDVGCGDGAVSHRLAEAGATVTGVDPSAAAIAQATARAGAGERYVRGSAEQLPLEDGHADAVTFLNSFHHVRPARLRQALAEVRRVLRAGGVLYIQEPLAEGRYYELVRLIEDETEVRAAAQRALHRADHGGLAAAAELEYDAPVRHRDFASFRKRMVLVDPRRAAALASREHELEARFRQVGETGPDGWSFLQPTRVTLLRRIS